MIENDRKFKGAREDRDRRMAAGETVTGKTVRENLEDVPSLTDIPVQEVLKSLEKSERSISIKTTVGNWLLELPTD